MKFMTLSILTALFVASSTDSATAQPTPKKQDTQLTAGHLASWTVPVTGLTKDNAVRAQKIVNDLQLSALPKLKLDKPDKLDKPEGSCFHNVRLDTEKNELHFTILEKRELRLTELDKALKPIGIRVDQAKLAIENHSEVLVQGDVTADQMAEIDTAIRDAKLFKEFKHVANEKTDTCHFIITATTPMAKLASFEKLLTEFYGDDMKTDILWTGVRLPVGIKG